MKKKWKIGQESADRKDKEDQGKKQTQEAEHSASEEKKKQKERRQQEGRIIRKQEEEQKEHGENARNKTPRGTQQTR